MIGIHYGLQPALVVIDPELAKNIMITDFSHFTDTVGSFTVSLHSPMVIYAKFILLQIDKEVDPLIGLNPFFLKGDEWKEKRGEISPAFTSGRVI